MTDRSLVTIFYKIAFPVSIVLLTISLAVHLITFAPVNVQDHFPPVFLLHLGIFALFIPIVFIDRVLMKSPSMVGIDEPHKQPVWMWLAYFLLGGYVAFNFLYFLIASEGQPEIEAGKYWLKNKGVVVRELTRQEYDAASAQILHGFSGHWLIFYFYIACASYSGKKTFKNDIHSEM